MMKSIPEIAEILLKSGYLNLQICDGKIINNIKFLPLGSIFLNKIKLEWQQNRGITNTYLIPNPNSNAYSNNYNNTLNFENFSYIKLKKFHENFLHIKNNFQKETPLAIKEEFQSSFSTLTSTSVNQKNPNDIDDHQAIESNNLQIHTTNSTLLTCTYFINEQLANEYFYKIQRERKIWWMKLSSNPGRYFLTDLKSNEQQKSQSIKIKAKFYENVKAGSEGAAAGNEFELENIHVIPLKALKLNNQNDFHLKDQRLNKRIIPAIVRTEMQLEVAAIDFLFDSVEDSKNGKMSIHRRIAPYQCCLFCYSEDEKTLFELTELATHLTNIIRKCGISVLNLPKCSTTNEIALKKEILHMDRIGVPYSLILNRDTIYLKNGLIQLRNRETQLAETIHISDIPDYLLRIFNSE